MTALSAPVVRQTKPGAIITQPVKATVTVYSGAKLQLNGGYCQPATGDITLPFAGYARSGTTAASSVDGAREIDTQVAGEVQDLLANATIADIGKEVYLGADDNTLTLKPGGPAVGAIKELVSAGVVLVDITGYALIPTTGPLHIKIPFTKQTSEADTGYDLPARMLVEYVFPECVTNVSGATIDIGLLSTESGGDADGLTDGASLTTAGIVVPVLEGAAATDITLGALLNAGTVKSADATAIYAAIRRRHYAGTVTAKSISYTTSNHTVAGYIHVIGKVI